MERTHLFTLDWSIKYNMNCQRVKTWDGVTRAKLENGTKRNRTTSQHIKIGEIGKIGVQQNRQAKMGDKLFNHTGSSLKAFRAEYTTAASTFNQM